MQAYLIKYKIKSQEIVYSTGVDAKNLKSSKNKIERKEGKRIVVVDSSVTGYY